jgi:hypothetical protein
MKCNENPLHSIFFLVFSMESEAIIPQDNKNQLSRETKALSRKSDEE